MKKSWILHLLLLVLILSCSGKGVRYEVKGFDFFNVYIEQNGTIFDNQGKEITLRREPFSIIVLFNKPDGLLVNASWEPWAYNTALHGAVLTDIPGFSGTGAADELFNKDQVLVLSRKSPNYWYYQGDSDNRFSEVTKRNNIYFCKRTISNIVEMDKSMDRTDITATRANVLYLVFLKVEWDESFKRKTEKKRDYIKINFSNQAV